MRPASAVTVTDSETCPTSSVKLPAFTCSRAERMISVFTSFLNPDFSTVMSYLPGGSWGATKTPELLVLIVRAKLVASFATLTVASEIIAPVLSTTVPVIDPLVLCPKLTTPSNTVNSKATIERLTSNVEIIRYLLLQLLASSFFDELLFSLSKPEKHQ